MTGIETRVFDTRNRVVLGLTFVSARAGSPVNRQRLDASVFGDFRHDYAVSVLDGSHPVRIFSVTGTSTAATTASGSSRRAFRLVSNAPSRPGVAAHLLRWAAHIDVDDLCAAIDHGARCSSQLLWLRARNLHGYGFGAQVEVEAAPRFGGLPEASIRCRHFRGGHARSELPAKGTERLVCDTSHGGENEPRGQQIGTDAHA